MYMRNLVRADVLSVELDRNDYKSPVQFTPGKLAARFIIGKIGVGR